MGVVATASTATRKSRQVRQWNRQLWQRPCETWSEADQSDQRQQPQVRLPATYRAGSSRELMPPPSSAISAAVWNGPLASWRVQLNRNMHFPQGVRTTPNTRKPCRQDRWEVQRYRTRAGAANRPRVRQRSGPGGAGDLVSAHLLSALRAGAILGTDDPYSCTRCTRL